MYPTPFVGNTVGTHASSAPTTAAHAHFVTMNAFLDDLQAVSRRLGYPLDGESVRMLAATVTCTPEQWLDHRDSREAAMAQLRKLMLRAVLKAVNGGYGYVDARIMALAIADERAPAV